MSLTQAQNLLFPIANRIWISKASAPGVECRGICKDAGWAKEAKTKPVLDLRGKCL
jgi:hypothetical protein